MNNRRPGKPRQPLVRDRVLTVAVVAAIVALALLVRAAFAQQPETVGDGDKQPVVVAAAAGRIIRPAADPLYQGKPAEWWAGKTVHWKRAAVKRGHTLHRIRRGLRHQVMLSGNGVAAGLRCIHSFEGSWTDPGAPFWGGLQMDMQFQRSYGGAFLSSIGTADRWPPFVQLSVAMEAYYSGRGFTPWPNTRRMCGL